MSAMTNLFAISRSTFGRALIGHTFLPSPVTFSCASRSAALRSASTDCDVQ